MTSVTLAAAAAIAAAGRLGSVLSDDSAVLERATTAQTALENRLAAVQNNGQLKTFNQEFQKRRKAAERAGKKFINYQTARARLRSLLAAAADGRPTGDIIRRAFEGE